MKSLVSNARVAAIACAIAGAVALSLFKPEVAFADNVKVRAAYVPVATWLPAWVAKEKGIFERNGLDVSLTRFPNVVLLPGAMGKQFDLAPTTAPDFLNAVRSGLDLVAVAGGAVETNARRTYLLIAGPANIASAKDLEGKRVATAGLASVMHVAFIEWMKANGANPATVKVVEVPFPNMLDQLKAGRVDAVEALQPFAGQMMAAGYKPLGAPLLSVADPVLFPFWMSDRKWAEANRDTIGKWIKSLNEALQLIEKDDGMARQVLSQYTGLPAEVVARIPYPAYQFTITPKEIATWQKVMVDQGTPVGGLDTNKLIVTTNQ